MISSITIKNKVRIIDNKYVVKKKNKELENTFNYLKSRSFNYFPEIINEENNNIYYEYIEDINEPKEQKIEDLIILLSILHLKTTMYKEVDIDYYKSIYENTNDKIDEIYKYYNNLMDDIENKIYMSPSHYLLARNITSIYKSLNYAKEHIKTWYSMVENKTKVRLVTIHNNPKVSHYIKNNKPYLISWDNTKIDMPIYDLIKLYKNHYLEFDFINIIKIYLNKYPLNKEEIILFLTLIAIPEKIKKTNNEYTKTINTNNIIEYIYKTNEILKEYGIKKQTNKDQELNK